MITRSFFWMASTIIALGVALTGCERKESDVEPRKPVAEAAKPAAESHDHDHDHDHASEAKGDVVDWPALLELDMFVHTAEMAIEGKQLAPLKPLMQPMTEKARMVAQETPKNAKDPKKVAQLQADLKNLLDSSGDIAAATPEAQRDFALAMEAIVHELMESAGTPHKH